MGGDNLHEISFQLLRVAAGKFVIKEDGFRGPSKALSTRSAA